MNVINENKLISVFGLVGYTAAPVGHAYLRTMRLAILGDSDLRLTQLSGIGDQSCQRPMSRLGRNSKQPDPPLCRVMQHLDLLEKSHDRPLSILSFRENE